MCLHEPALYATTGIGYKLMWYQMGRYRFRSYPHKESWYVDVGQELVVDEKAGVLYYEKGNYSPPWFGEPYRKGFHIYLERTYLHEKCREHSLAAVVKVKFSDVVATGLQAFTLDDRGYYVPCAVARRMTLIGRVGERDV